MSGASPVIPACVRGLTYAVYSPLDPSFVGGIRSWIQFFWPKYLRATDSRLVVVHCGFKPRGGVASQVNITGDSIETIKIPSYRVPGLSAPIPSARALGRVFAERKVDVAYVDNGYAFQDVVALRAGSSAGCAMISGHHAVIRHGGAHNLAWRIVGRPAVRRYDAVHVLNNDDASYLRSLGCGNVHVVAIAVDERTFTFADRPGGAVRCCFVGRLHHQKGIDRLAFLVRALVDRHGKDIVIDIAGDGPERPEVERLAEVKQVTYHGQQAPAEIARLMGRSDILLMPSRHETFGIVAAEAMMCGTAVLYSDLPALEQIVGVAAGEPVPNTDEISPWIAGAERLIERVKGRRFPAISSEAVRANALSRFSLGEVIPQFGKLVETALAKAHTS